MSQVRTALQSVGSVLSHVRVLDNILEFVKHISCLINLKTLALHALGDYDVTPVHAALQALPVLKTLHLCSSTPRTTAVIPAILSILPQLPKVKGLRVATDTHMVQLSAASLVHITSLFLGRHAGWDEMPADLQGLCQEDVRVQVQTLSRCSSKRRHTQFVHF